MRSITGRAAQLGRWLASLSLLGLVPLILMSCAPDQSQSTLGCASAPTPCLSGTALVSLTTARGEVLVQLDGDQAPLTSGNFVELVGKGIYNGTVFHRVVREPVPFVVQGGDPQSADPNVPSTQYGLGNYIDPASGESRLIPLELKLKDEADPRYGEQITNPVLAGQLALTHQRGAVAMARSQDFNSASAQFYIALEALPELDGRYAVFGKVVEGMEVVDKLSQGDRLIKAQLLEGGKLVRGTP